MEDLLNEFLLISNPGYHHIAEELLLSLDLKNLLKCRLVNSTWKNFLDMNPTFWIKKCQQFGLRDEICTAWIKLAQKLEQPDLIQNLVLYMMKMLHGAPYSFQYPIHVAIKNTDKALALFIIENMDVYLGKNSSGSNSIHLASEKGMVDIVAALKSLYVTPDSPNSDGKTPTQLAEINGHSEVIGILSPSTCTTFLACRPSTSRKDGINDTDFDLGSFGKKKKKKRSISLENRINKDDSIANINIESGIGEILTEPEPMDVD